MMQKDLNEENKAIMKKAYELYEEHGFKDGNDFIDWLEAEKLSGFSTKLRRHKQTRNMLVTIAAILCIILVVLVFIWLRPNPQSDSTQPAEIQSELKIMVLVLDPSENESLVVFSDTHFDYDMATLTTEAKTLLKQNVQVLNENPGVHVRMAGYTSAQGSEEINQVLSEKRANNVRDYLVEQGIAPERITVIGYGKTRPAVYEINPGDIFSKAAKANMRVIFEISVE